MALNFSPDAAAEPQQCKAEMVVRMAWSGLLGVLLLTV